MNLQTYLKQYIIFILIYDLVDIVLFVFKTPFHGSSAGTLYVAILSSKIYRLDTVDRPLVLHFCLLS